MCSREVIHLIRAVEGDALFSEGFGKIFYRPRLTCTGRTSQSSTKIEEESTHKCYVAPVCKWGNDESHGVTKVLITIWEVTIEKSILVKFLNLIPKNSNLPLKYKVPNYSQIGIYQAYLRILAENYVILKF